MKRAAVFFDRDNTLIANDGYLGDPKGVVLAPGAAEAVARARGLGLAVVVFSNQSGVARGMFTEEAVHAVNQRLDEMLLDDDAGAVIDRHEFCPYHPQASVERYRQDSDLRKPKPGMIFQAERQLALDLSRSWVVGDAPRDIDAGRAAGCRTILVTHTEMPASPASWEEGQGKPDFEVTSLKDALDVIERHVTPSTTAVAEADRPVKRPAEASAPAATEATQAVPPAGTSETNSSAPRSEEPVETARASGAKAYSSQFRGDEVSEAEAGPDTSPPPASPDAEAERDTAFPGRPGRATSAENPLRAAQSGAGSLRPKARSEVLLEQILDELRRRHEQHADADFSVSKLMAGVMQIVALAALFLAAMYRDKTDAAFLWLLVAIFLQVFTIALLIMGRQR